MSPVNWQSRIRDNALVLVIGYELDNPRIVVPIPTGANIFLVSLVSPPVLGPTHLSSQWATGFFLWEKRVRQVNANAHMYLMPRNECRCASTAVKELPVLCGICTSITVFIIARQICES